MSGRTRQKHFHRRIGLIAIGIFLAACTPRAFMTQTVVRETRTPSSTIPTNVHGSPIPDIPTFTPPILTATAISPSETPLAKNSSTLPDQFVYFYENIVAQYGVINYLALSPKGVSYPPKFWPLGVGQAWSVGFAHFADRLLFLKGDYVEESRHLQVWVSDLRGQDATQIFTETETTRIEYLEWTPDDQHLIIKTKAPSESGLIYHVQTGDLEAWPYACDQLARSPLSSRLVLWCQPASPGDDFAVIEWGGDIWLSFSPPDEVFAPAGNAAWSADGARLAYSDDADPEGNLYLLDESGHLIRTLPGIMQWRAQSPRDLSSAINKWSANGERLLIFAPGTQEKPCLPDSYDWFSDGPNPNPPCWHVYDVKAGQMIWDLPDSINEAGIYGSNDFEPAALSADGRFLALGVNGPDDQQRGIWIIDLETGQKIWEFGVWVPYAMRWGSAFEADFSFPN